MADCMQYDLLCQLYSEGGRLAAEISRPWVEDPSEADEFSLRVQDANGSLRPHPANFARVEDALAHAETMGFFPWDWSQFVAEDACAGGGKIRDLITMHLRCKAAEAMGDEDKVLHIREDECPKFPLGLSVRDGWRAPGENSEGAEEFLILLSSGGPNVRIMGRLNAHGEVEVEGANFPVMEGSWYSAWTETPGQRQDAASEAIGWFCQQFYFPDE